MTAYNTELNFVNDKPTMTVTFFIKDFFTTNRAVAHSEFIKFISEFRKNNYVEVLIFDMASQDTIDSYGIGLIMRLLKVFGNVKTKNTKPFVRNFLNTLVTEEL